MDEETMTEAESKINLSDNPAFTKGMEEGLYYLGFMNALAPLGFGATELQDILKTKMLIDAEKEMGKELTEEADDLSLV